nr:MAG: replication-associated protein [Aegithalos caudatus CRESS-DNA-virus sp.]
MTRAHGWCFTSYVLEPEPVFDPSIAEYLIYGRETCPSTNRSHLQGYIYFKERKRLPFLKTWLPTAHFEGAKGSPEQNKIYCSKDGDFTEHGGLPRVKSGGSAFKAVLEQAQEGNIAAIKEQYPGIYIRYKTNIESSVRFRAEELNGSCGVWICGPPRCGKDASVRRLQDVYVKSLNKWWDGYRNQKYVLISDVDPDHGKWLGSFLKIWSDRYPFTAEIKGGSLFIRPTKIFVTSNFRLGEVFSGQILAALEARFSVFDEFSGTVKKREEGVLCLTVYDKLLLCEDGLQETILQTSTSNDMVEEKENLPSTSSFSPKAKRCKGLRESNLQN